METTDQATDQGMTDDQTATTGAPADGAQVAGQAGQAQGDQAGAAALHALKLCAGHIDGALRRAELARGNPHIAELAGAVEGLALAVDALAGILAAKVIA